METAKDDPGVRLMLAYQAGDESAFDQLVEAYSGQIYALLTRFLGPAPQREDLVQEVFLRVIRARARYQPTARFSTWLYRIAFNLSANERERSVSRQGVSLDSPEGQLAEQEWSDSADLAPHARLEREDLARVVREAIAALPAGQRMALILAKYEELPYAEVAQVLESTEKAIKSMIHRARENLRVTLAPYLQEELA